MRGLKGKKWLFPAAVVLLLCVTALGVQLSVGAYIRRSYVKAVIATNETEKLFGSNLLYGIKNQPTDPEKDDWLAVYPFTVSNPDQQRIEVPIKIYNYLVEDKDRVNQLDVSYVISFKIDREASATGSMDDYTVKGYAVENFGTVYYLGAGGLTTDRSQAAKQTLPGRQPFMEEYKVTIPGADLGKVSIAVKAQRVSNVGGDGNSVFGTDLLYLAARVVPSLASTVQTATVQGSFVDQDKETPAGFDAYNYDITLTGAPTAVVLNWNPELLEIDPFFAEKFGVAPDADGGQVMFYMEPGITRIQFYRKGSGAAASWGELGVKVTER